MDLETLVGSYAFPIVMCLWFMFRTDKLITENTNVTRELKELIIKLQSKD